ncbi:methyl-accepting chemotaxis protein [Occallatibacter riparius]|uniref:Cache 3/Cache 2 fusion domain-containing protein n=1 Tax=Occallatibacter riparius TaxID=1002689 RepID=A0A9J7BKL8_9BACT|nr:Cache 3/Cache 2 fusion domain-containing protein [Occallatibacter riparius]UWZ83420.1 Cache 3/Cache 2 fusion domain-containing protein [Occallatibacter riparius]
MRRQNLSLRQQITYLGTFSAMLATVVVAILVVVNENRASKAVSDEVIGIMQDRLARSAEKTYSICKLSQDLVQNAVDTSLKLGDAALKQAGGVQTGSGTVTWDAVNQFTHEKKTIAAPQWSLKGTPLRPDVSFSHSIPVIDEITKQTGETVTLFQRVNAAGDMLRVATTVATANGERAIGTFMPAIEQSGTPNDVVRTVLSGQTYRGRAFVVNAWYISAYEPLRDAAGNIIGMFYVGVKQEGVTALREAIAGQAHSGDRSSVAVYYGKASRNFSDMVVIPPTGIGSLTESKWLKQVLDKAPLLAEGTSGQLVVNGTTSESQAIIRYSYFKPWDWVIVAIGDSKDYTGAADLVREQFTRLLFQSTLGGLIALLIGGVFAYFISKRITNPVADLSINLTSSATQISSSAVHQQSNVTSLMASSNQIASAAKEISATSQELLRTMVDIAEAAERTAGLAHDGRQGLKGMETSMQTLSTASDSISGRLATIRAKAVRINSVVTAITKVADQTNLLSLNASIEAEKAGEAGAGFAVVAREIRRLADQSAIATLDIEQIVEEMQEAVGSGVAEMRQFSEAVQGGIGAAETIQGQFGEIIERVESIAPRYETVQQGMQNQSVGAKQISDAMWQLTETARQTSDSVNDLNEVSRQLHEAVRILKEHIFKVAAVEAH